MFDFIQTNASNKGFQIMAKSGARWTTLAFVRSQGFPGPFDIPHSQNCAFCWGFCSQVKFTRAFAPQTICDPHHLFLDFTCWIYRTAVASKYTTHYYQLGRMYFYHDTFSSLFTVSIASAPTSFLARSR